MMRATISTLSLPRRAFSSSWLGAVNLPRNKDNNSNNYDNNSPILNGYGRPTLLAKTPQVFALTTRTLIIPPNASYRRRNATGRLPRFSGYSSPSKRLTRFPNRNQPTAASATSMPLSVEEMDNDSLAVLGRMGDHQARKEMLKRHIMVQDKVSYEEASESFQKIAKKNGEGRFIVSLPYHIGILMALSAGFASFPLCFDLNTAEWFNAAYVTTEVPEPEDLETPLEVGAWAWNWMEPPLGQISFFLLCLQFSRSQMENLGIKPYTKRVKRWRAEYLASLFPQYDSRVIIAYSLSSNLVDED